MFLGFGLGVVGGSGQGFGFAGRSRRVGPVRTSSRAPITLLCARERNSPESMTPHSRDGADHGHDRQRHRRFHAAGA
jgi:hypothetical protein